MPSSPNTKVVRKEQANKNLVAAQSLFWDHLYIAYFHVKSVHLTRKELILPFWPQKLKTTCTLDTEWFPWHQEPQQPQWPQQPQQPQWPRWPQQPLFIKKLGELNVFINPSTKMTYPGLSVWNGSSKIHYFIDFWHSFCWRLWRPCMLLLTKSKGHKSNAIILGTCWKP